MNEKRQIIALSGGFSIEPRNKRMDRYILSSVENKKPKICFLPTASGDSKNYVKRFYNFFEKENCEPVHLPLFKATITNLEEFILNQDIIYVGGGNTKNMLAIWKDWGLDDILKKAYHNGVLLCGVSAGSLCWFEQGLTDSIPEKLTKIDCIGLLEGSNSPFCNFGSAKMDTYREMIKNNKIIPGIATEIGVGLHYVNENLIKVISSRKGVNAYDISKKSEQLISGNLLELV